MSEAVHPVAYHHLPPFITAPGENDILMTIMGIVLIAVVLGVGVLFLRLHTLPERIAHRGHKLQFEIVAVLGPLALFTHIHLFWVAGLLLALIDFPDFGGLLGRMARSLEKMAGLAPAEAQSEAAAERAQPIVAGVPPGAADDLPATLSRGDDREDELSVHEVAELKTGSTRS